VNGGEHILFDDPFADQDRILKIIPAPAHEGDHDVSPQSQLTVVGRRPVGEDLALQDHIALLDQRLLVDAGVLVRAFELDEFVDIDPASGFHGLFRYPDDDPGGIDVLDHPGSLRHDGDPAVPGDPPLDTGSHQGRAGLNQRYRLPLHVRTHEGAVGVVMIQERDQRGRHAHQLIGRDVHVLDLFRRHQHVFTGLAGGNLSAGEASLFIQGGIGLGNRVFLFIHGGEILDIAPGGRRFDLPIGGFDETVRVDPGVGRK